MKLEWMKELLALQSYGSFSLAAEKLFLTQPSLSRHIAAMEQELGVQLIERNTHSFAFTEEGLVACKTFQQMLCLYDEMNSEFDQRKAGIVGTLHLGVLYYSIHDDIGDMLMRFGQEYPKVNVILHSCQPREVFEGLMENKMDIGILPRSKFGTSKGLVFRDFDATSGVAMMSINHPLAQKSTVTLDELQQETLILLQEDEYFTKAILGDLEKVGFCTQKTIYTAHTDTVPFEILEGKGIFITGTYSYPGFEDKIRSIEISDEILRFPKSFAWQRDNSNPLIQCFLNLLK